MTIAAIGSRMALAVLAAITASAHGEARLDWFATVHQDGKHNAFTDLVQWRTAYYLCFRHAASHGSMDGEIRVLRSADLKTWAPCATLDTPGDDRDPHFVATDSSLVVYFGTWDLVHKPGHALPDRGSVRSYCASTADGQHWSKIQGVYEPGWWLWRVRRGPDAFYSAAYTAVRPKPDARETRLLRSADGLEWTQVATVTRERLAGEADILFLPDRAAWLISRTGDAAGDAVWFRSDATLTRWEGRDTGVFVHSPAIATWKNRCFLAGRGKTGEAYVTKLWEIAGDRLVELLTLPSGGDTGYPGLIADPASVEGECPALFVSWYSQHEARSGERNGQDPKAAKDAASIYVGRVVFQP